MATGIDYMHDARGVYLIFAVYRTYAPMDGIAERNYSFWLIPSQYPWLNAE